MNWRDYEKEIYEYFTQSFPGTSIKYDQKIDGRYSKVERQIDVLIEGNVAGFDIRIIIDCKYFSKNINVKDVESFSAMVEDVEADHGVLITNKGYSKAAINRAHYGPQKVDLDILNFDEIHKFQGALAIPYVGHNSVLAFAPLGWIIDVTKTHYGLATLYQRGLSLKKAQKNCEWMYINFYNTEENDFSVEDLIDFQNKGINEVDPNTKFTYETKNIRKDSYPTKIRIAKVNSYPCLEVTGFVQFEGFIFFIVLFTPEEHLNKNLRKLRYVLSVAEQAKIEFDNTKVIAQLTEEIKNSKDLEEKSEKHFKIGDWYKEMYDYPNALLNYRKAVEYYPTHYPYLKKIVHDELKYGDVDKAIQYSSQLLKLEPQHPTLPQNLIDTFFKLKKEKLLRSFFKEKIKTYADTEVLGNLYFHLGLVELNMGLEREARKNFKKSRSYFEKIFNSDHQVFKSIDKII